MKVRRFEVIRSLPRSVLEGIGAVCFEWAHLERELSGAAYNLLGISPARGRIAVRSPRANERLAMIRQLLSLEEITVRSVDLDALAKSLGDWERLRDNVAHGIWVKGPDGEILLQVLSGNWAPSKKDGKVPRRIVPEGIEVDLSDLKNLAEIIRGGTKVIQKMHEEILAALESSGKKSQPQFPQDHPPDGSSSGNN